jgi:uncharacterized protein YceK
MKIFALVMLVALTTLSGCGATIRDKTVYATEVQYVDMTVRREAPAVRRFLMTACTCSVTFEWTATAEGVSTDECAAAADWYRVYTSRWAWHIEMIRYNGRVTDTDPGQIPEVTTSSCDLPELPLVTEGGDSHSLTVATPEPPVSAVDHE